MASDPTAGGAPAEMPVESSDPNLDIPPKPEGVAAEVEQLQAEKADLQDKLLRALAEARSVASTARRDPSGNAAVETGLLADCRQ